MDEIDSSISDSWTCEMNKCWTRATKIIYSYRMARLSFEGNVNEVLMKRNLQEHTANKFRELFASMLWDPKMIDWLHSTLLKHLHPSYESIYLDSLNIIRQKIPGLLERFHQFKTDTKTKITQNDPLFNTLSHYKLKKLPRKPIFLFLPPMPNQSINDSARLRYWTSLFGAMGKLISISFQAKPSDLIQDILSDIRFVLGEKIRNCRNSFPSRPIILVGFGSSALISAHCALQNQKSISAIVCLGFPLKTVDGIRGELGDIFLELCCPMQFIVGENSILSPLDEIEDFREKICKTETSLIVVGGADDNLVISNTKKRLECLTQSMVDRCVADEIYDFLSPIMIRYTEESNLSLSDFKNGLDEIVNVGTHHYCLSSLEKNRKILKKRGRRESEKKNLSVTIAMVNKDKMKITELSANSPIKIEQAKCLKTS
ncbi:hypothetical protein SSS_10543 [Sarcoptes scabiei]|nr:hypothetical protein SSS_10543 [Sarcoptes scabiei]